MLMVLAYFLVCYDMIWMIVLLPFVRFLSKSSQYCQQCIPNIDGLVQDCSNCTANTLELLQSCTKPLIYPYMWSWSTVLQVMVMLSNKPLSKSTMTYHEISKPSHEGNDILSTRNTPDINCSMHGSYRNLQMKFNDFSMTFQGPF